jgi:hypothetical protein
MTDRISKIFVLWTWASILFFPLIASATLEDDIRNFLEQSGFTVKEMSEVPVLVPESDMTFDIRNKNSIRNGKTQLYVDLFYKGNLYATVSMIFRLEGGQAFENSRTTETRPNVRRISSFYLVRKGDKVEVILKSGSLKIRSEGKILTDANRSDEVDVEILSSRKQMRGVLLDRKRVLVDREGENP